MIDAVLFDWGNTLAASEWSAELARAGNELGLAAVALADPPSTDAIASWWEAFLTARDPESLDELDVAAAARDCFAGLGAPLDDDALERYVDATQRHWVGVADVHPDTHALLEGLRAYGLRLAVVSNSTTPTRYLDEALAAQEIAQRVDARVYSSAVGKRKPHPAIFAAASEAVGVPPARTLFVGDRAYEDVHGARQAGMATVQALWYGAVDDPRGEEPDYRAAEPLDVLALAKTLRSRAA